ncbi:MAG: hypothetical protein QG629_357 [Patescibacteria group bacterium]|nr:PHP domain-containing protein [Candidatus Saccharibacteria bacterium]MDQ5963275.1 hypothetical protein [Patescibacteria group bacterium]
MYKIDLHTHSYGSSDGALTAEDYREALESGKLDYIAITDHNSIDTAKEIKLKLGKLGDRIIIGEEVSTLQGDIIGLFMTKSVGGEPLFIEDAIAAISKQGGLVYIPHPFSTYRSSVDRITLERIMPTVDIVEFHNGRWLIESGDVMIGKKYLQESGKPLASSSDSHGVIGWGKTFSVIAEPPTKENLLPQLKRATYSTGIVGLGVIYPKLNRIRKLLGR